MPTHLKSPTTIESAGNKPKLIEEYVGKINSHTQEVSIAQMQSPPGWVEPGQTPEFDEYTIVLEGELSLESQEDTLHIGPGQAVITHAGEWVRYSTPKGARYIAVCLPAFTPESVHRDND